MPKKQKPFILSKKNYYSPARPHISNSHIQDYIKSPAYYKAKHIEKTIKRKITPPMLRGSMVDDLLTSTGRRFQIKALKKDDPVKYEKQQTMDKNRLVTEEFAKQCKELAAYIKKQPVWQEHIDKATFQELLEGKIFESSMCGLADRIDRLPDGRIRIIDLKILAPQKLATSKKFLQNAFDSGYIRQLALYRELFCQMCKISESQVDCFLFAGAYLEDGLMQFKAFKIAPLLLMEAKAEVVAVVQDIERGLFEELPATIEELTF